MGLIDAINTAERAVMAPFWRLGTARLGTRLLLTGTPATATIDGIETTRSQTVGEQWMWLFGLTVHPPGGAPFKAGVKQNLVSTARQRVHLGMEVPVRYRGRHVVIDWPSMQRRFGVAPIGDDKPDGWRPLGKPPADGIHDHHLQQRSYRKRLETGRRTTAKVLAASHPTTVFGTDMRWEAIVRLTDDGRELSTATVEPPDYAVHLLGPGAVIPVAVDGDRVTIDWIAGASDPALLAEADARLDALLGVVTPL